MRLRLTHFAVAFAFALAAPSLADAQVLRGVVVDAVSGRPIAGARIVLDDLTDSIEKAQWTDDRGRFAIGTHPTDSALLTVSHVGNVQFQAAVFKLRAADTSTLKITLERVPAFLDTIKSVANKPTFFMSWASHGQEVFTEHYKRDTVGSMFMSGEDVVFSRLSIAKFFSKLSGFQLVDFKPPIGESLKDSVDNVVHWLTTNKGKTGVDCVVARYDWTGEVLGFSDLQLVVSAGPLAGVQPYGISVRDVVGIEIYRDATNAPAEWRQDIPYRCALIQFWSKFAW